MFEGKAGYSFPHHSMMFMTNNSIGYYNTRKSFPTGDFHGTFQIPKHWPYKEQLNAGLDRLKEAGVVERLLVDGVGHQVVLVGRFPTLLRPQDP